MFEVKPGISGKLRPIVSFMEIQASDAEMYLETTSLETDLLM